MGTINESKFFHRRVNLDKVEEMLKLHAQQVFYETKSYNQFKYELTLKAVEASIWQDFGLGWEDLPEEERLNHPIPGKPGEFMKYRMDMKNMQRFGERDYIEALSYIGVLPE